MMHFKIVIGALAIAISATACTKNVVIHPSSIPASDVMANRVIQSPTTYTFSDDLKRRIITATCAAYTYNADVGTPIIETIEKATKIGFSHANEGAADIRNDYNMRFDFDDVEGSISLIPGFWSSKVTTHVELSGTVDVTDRNGQEVAKAEISGAGSATTPGNCTDAQQAVQAATEKAIKKLGSDYVYKIIDTNVMH